MLNTIESELNTGKLKIHDNEINICNSIIEKNDNITNRRNECQELEGKCLKHNSIINSCDNKECNKLNCGQNGGKWVSVNCTYEEGDQCLWTDSDSQGSQNNISSSLLKNLKENCPSDYHWIYQLNRDERNKLNSTRDLIKDQDTHIYKNCLIHPYSELDNIQPLSIENVRIDSSDMTNTFDQANELGIPMSILSNTNNIPYINIPNKSYKNLSNNIKGDIIKSIQSQY